MASKQMMHFPFCDVRAPRAAIAPPLRWLPATDAPEANLDWPVGMVERNLSGEVRVFEERRAFVSCEGAG